MKLLYSSTIAIIGLAIGLYGGLAADLYLSLIIGGILGSMIGSVTGLFVLGVSFIVSFALIKHLNR